MLLGTSERWDDGELATVLISGLRLSTIEGTSALIRLPWPGGAVGEAPALLAQRALSTMINSGDDPNFRALQGAHGCPEAHYHPPDGGG